MCCALAMANFMAEPRYEQDAHVGAVAAEVLRKLQQMHISPASPVAATPPAPPRRRATAPVEELHGVKSRHNDMARSTTRTRTTGRKEGHRNKPRSEGRKTTRSRSTAGLEGRSTPSKTRSEGRKGRSHSKVGKENRETGRSEGRTTKIGTTSRTEGRRPAGVRIENEVLSKREHESSSSKRSKKSTRERRVAHDVSAGSSSANASSKSGVVLREERPIAVPSRRLGDALVNETDTDNAIVALAAMTTGKVLNESRRNVRVTNIEAVDVDASSSTSRTGWSGQRCKKHIWCGDKDAHAQICALYLNEARESRVFDFFAQCPGLGKRTAHRVLVERAAGGPFLSAADFDRRVARLNFARLRAAALALDRDVSLYVKPNVGPPDVVCSVALTAAPRSIVQNKKLRTWRLATWNAGHFSLTSKFVKEKTAHLTRFASDAAPLTVLALQEVYGDVPKHVAKALADATGARWQALSASGGAAASHMRQAFVYDADVLDALPVPNLLPMCERFVRMPQLAMFARRGQVKPVLALLNVHLSTRFKLAEARMLSQVLGAVRKTVELRGGSVDAVICLGDFNVSADADCFDLMSSQGFTELVRPPVKDAQINKRFLTTPTTVGDNWFDNFYMHKEMRARLRDAWCFDFGGRGAALNVASKYEYAGARRSMRSDHYAVVAEFDIADV